jgi:hypothetical protein
MDISVNLNRTTNKNTLDRKTLPCVITLKRALNFISYIAIYEPLCFEHDMKYVYKPLNIQYSPPPGVSYLN